MSAASSILPLAVAGWLAARALPTRPIIAGALCGLGGAFLSHDLTKELEQIRVNVGAVVALTHLFVRDMVARRRGGVINLASITSYLPMAYSAVYAASKSFVLSFSEALGREAVSLSELESEFGTRLEDAASRRGREHARQRAAPETLRPRARASAVRSSPHGRSPHRGRRWRSSGRSPAAGGDVRAPDRDRD